MRKSSLILAGVAVALAGATAMAAEHANEHVLTVRLPDGSIEHVRYTGDVAPHIVVRPVAVAAMPAPASLFAAAFGADSAFAEMDRMSAAMAQQQAAMMRQVAAMTASRPAQAGAAPQMVMMANAPAGAHFSYTSTTIINGKACTTSVQSISQGQGKAPQLLRQVSGDCSTAMQRPTGPVPAVAPAAPAAPEKLVPTSLPAPAKPKTVSPDSI